MGGLIRLARNARKTPPSYSRHGGSRRAAPGQVTEPKPPIRVLLVDNSLTFRDGLELAIMQTKTLRIAGRARSAGELFEHGTVVAADIALVDIDLPDQSGFEVCQRLLHANPKMNAVLIGYSDWDIYLLAAQTVHACGLLLRSQTTLELIAALEKVASGSIFSQEQIQRIQIWRNTTGTKLKSLGRREWQVLQLLSLGQSNREMAQHLSVTENTVEKHVSNILQKLELATRAMMIVFIFTHHLDGLSRLPHGDRFLMMLAN